jgi:hypothetical protein
MVESETPLLIPLVVRVRRGRDELDALLIRILEDPDEY